jgi:hypothetical protein
LKGKIDPLKYVLCYYRSPYEKQPEFGMPLDYKTLHFSRELASNESLTLMKAIDAYKPHFYYTLHNHAFCGAYFLLGSPSERLYPLLQSIIKRQNIILYTGEPEEPYQEKYADGVYQITSVKKKYDYFRRQQSGDPAENFQGGGGVVDYLQENIPGAVSLSSEVPYFTADVFADNSPSGISKKEALVRGAQGERTILSFMEEQYTTLKDLLPDNRLKQSVEKRAAYLNNRSAALLKEIEHPKYDKEATDADVYNAIQRDAFYAACELGQVYRLALQAGEVKQAEEIKAYIQRIIDDINRVSPIKPVPLQKLVAIQVAAGLTVQQQLALN